MRDEETNDRLRTGPTNKSKINGRDARSTRILKTGFALARE